MRVQRHDAVTTYDLTGLTERDVRTILAHLQRGDGRCAPDRPCPEAEDLAMQIEEAMDDKESTHGQ